MGQDKLTSEHKVENENKVTERPTRCSCDYCDLRCISESITTFQTGVNKLLQDKTVLIETLTKLQQGNAA